jgi:hypothetical protein
MWKIPIEMPSLDDMNDSTTIKGSGIWKTIRPKIKELFDYCTYANA